MNAVIIRQQECAETGVARLQRENKNDGGFTFTGISRNMLIYSSPALFSTSEHTKNEV